MTTSSVRQVAPWRAISAGASATFVGIGLARFVYTPLLPELISNHWFSETAGAYLGAANLAGYLIGALAARRVARRLGDPWALRWSMALATVSILACCVPVSVTWFFLWRLVSGLAGGVIMVRVAGAVLPYLPDRRRGLAGGAVFLGLGLGIPATGTLIPLLLGSGLRATWIGLAVLCAVLTAFSWKGWPTPVRTDSPAPRAARPQTPAHKDSGSLKLGIVPVFLGRVQQLVPRPEAQAPAWGKATIVSALFLALASYGFSYLFGQSGGDHRLLFTIGICAVVGGLLFDAASHLVRSGPARESGPSVEARDAGHAVKLLKP